MMQRAGDGQSVDGDQSVSAVLSAVLSAVQQSEVRCAMLWLINNYSDGGRAGVACTGRWGGAFGGLLACDTL